jgi:hypothetical protein
MIHKMWEILGLSLGVWAVATAAALLLGLGYLLWPAMRTAWVARGFLLFGVLSVVAGGFRTELVDEVMLHTPEVTQVKEIDPAKAAELKARAAKVRFAEDSKTDALDIAGASKSELDPEKAAAGADEPKYAYQKRGKQNRDAAQAVTRPAGEGDRPAEEAKPKVIIKLEEPYYSSMRRFDHMALSLSSLLLWGGILLVLADYVLRTRRMFAPVVPFAPVARLTRATLPERNGHVWVARGALDGHPLGVLAAIRAVQKDATSLYVGPAEPWSGRSLARLVIPSTACRLASLTYSGQAGSYPAEYVLESLWHGRACVAVVGRERGQMLLKRLVEMIDNKELMAYPGKTVIQVVWDLPQAPDAALLESLLACAQKAGLQLLVISDAPAPTGGGVKFAEVHNTMPSWDLTATPSERALMWIDDKLFARGTQV